MDTYGTDKIRLGYLDVYHPILVPWLDKEIKLLELGVYHLYQGHSLELWRDYLPRATIVEIDLELPCGFVPGERIEVFQGSHADTRFLSEVAGKTAPDGFDMIIDDASHIGQLTRTAFWHLFDNHLKGGGLYAIEELGTSMILLTGENSIRRQCSRNACAGESSFPSRVIPTAWLVLLKSS